MVKKTKEIVEPETVTEQPKGIESGVYDSIELVPNTTVREEKFNEIVTALVNGKFFVLPFGYSQNSLYVRIRKLKECEQLKGKEIVYSKTKTPDGLQYVLFVRKETKKE